MPRHSAHALRFSYHERHKRHAQDLDMAALPDGSDFFALAREAWTCVKGRDEKRGRSFQVGPAIVSGRTALLVGRVGHYGAPAQIRDVQSDQVVFTHDGNLANEPEARLFLACPGPGQYMAAYMIVEEIAEGSLKAPYLDALRRLWNMRFPNFTLKVDSISESEAWLETAHVTQFTVTYKNQTADLSDHDGNGPEQVLGTVRSVIVPPKGTFFRRKTLDLVKQNRRLAGRLIGRPEESDEPDSVAVTMRGPDSREKTFSIDNERTPLTRWIFSEHGQPTLTHEQHTTRCLQEVRDLLHREGVQWDTRWEHD